MNRHHCIICGYLTLESRCEYEVCEICYWEDDLLFEGSDDWSPANGDLRISEAQANFLQFGACHSNVARFTRPPSIQDVRVEGWKPLPRALELTRHNLPENQVDTSLDFEKD